MYVPFSNERHVVWKKWKEDTINIIFSYYGYEYSFDLLLVKGKNSIKNLQINKKKKISIINKHISCQIL